MAEFEIYNRRNFIGAILKTVALMGFAGLPVDLLAAKNIVRITILHTNDTHSRIDPFPMNDPKYPGMGGVARRKELINKIRSENEHVLLLDSGDIFQGTPYFNLYGGEVEFKMMTQLKYDASTLGNHDFDNGISGFVKQLPHAGFPFLNVNYDFSKTELKEKTLPYKIFENGGIKTGVFGVGIELKGLVEEKLYGNTIYLDPVETAQATATQLKKKHHCDLVICLSHLGYKYENQNKISDEQLAKKTNDIDLILGGHTHTFLDQPERFSNKSGKDVLVAQAGWAGIRLGRIDFLVEKKTGKVFSSGSSEKVSTKSS
ncbi:metallophosphatase [soil metagenome]